MANEVITLENLSEFKTKFQENLKTINGESIIGSGNLVIGGDDLWSWNETKKVISTEKVPGFTIKNDISGPSMTLESGTRTFLLSQRGITYQEGDNRYLEFYQGRIRNYQITFDEEGIPLSNGIEITLNGINKTENGSTLPAIFGTLKTINNQNILGSGNISTRDDALWDEVDGKQDRLISGTNIKTINGNTILGYGNIEIGGSDVATKIVAEGVKQNDKVISVFSNGDEYETIRVTQANARFSSYGYDDYEQAVEIDGINGDVKLHKDYDEGWISLYDTAKSVINKQDKLVSGTNVKTINGESILGSGNLGNFVTSNGSSSVTSIQLVSSEPSTKVPGVLYMLFE